MDATPQPLNMDALRAQFPLLQAQAEQGRVYLDNAATAQKPQAMLDAQRHFYQQQNANVHRAAHQLAAEATQAFEQARQQVAAFLNAARAEEIIWTRGATEAINLVANSYAASQLQAGDEILISVLEHHANIVPWQLLAARQGLVLKAIPLDQTSGELDLQQGLAMIGPRTKLLALSQMSNVLGYQPPLAPLIAAARQQGAAVLLDGTQAVVHGPVDVQALDCDFYVCSAHKLYGPTGLGVLYGRYALLEQMPPWQGGGEMIESVSLSAGSRFQPPPLRFEAGTPAIAEVISFAASLSYWQSLPRAALWQHEQRLFQRLLAGCRALADVRLPACYQLQQPNSILAMSFRDAHPQDIGTLLDMQGYAVRVGHHCAMPLLQALNCNGLLRVSLAFYNTEAEVDGFLQALERALTEF
ncbi:aminotransferase class V-fold PLP-dependent enzyme [Balneatrix alpica]|uniref:aminotransferase class V-fold PLP-dependent enzyme n=1 Tax=Balneatrix alpica TaxID=75684 RepID=UPI002738AAF8|nr:cysteine desulfurase [Balneatrix alpica]